MININIYFEFALHIIPAILIILHFDSCKVDKCTLQSYADATMLRFFMYVHTRQTMLSLPSNDRYTYRLL